MDDDLSKSVILVVDDDEDHAMMLELALELLGYRVLTAHSCAQARAVLEGTPVDVLVSDLVLGDGTAIDLVSWLGARRPRVCVVLSGFDAEEDIERSRAAGIDAHLVKPTPVQRLSEIIADRLARVQSGVQRTDRRQETPASPARVKS